MNSSDILGLVPVRNGEKYLSDFFLFNNRFITNYLFLNDNSTDNTLEIIQQESKVLKIIQAEYREDFRDDLNRNTLLEESYNLRNKFEWVVWLDSDEILYNVDFTHIPSICTVLKFKYIHLWNSSDTYNKDYPYSNDGIQLREKGFRLSELDSEYKFNTKLHFNQIPIKYNQENTFTLNGYVLHRGNIDYNDRLERFKRYSIEDPFNTYQSIGYNHFLNNNPRLGNIADIL
jgi:hypothetical protein